MRSRLFPLLCTLFPLTAYAANLPPGAEAKFREAATKGHVPDWLLDPALDDLAALLDTGKPGRKVANRDLVIRQVETTTERVTDPACIKGSIGFLASKDRTRGTDWIGIGYFCKRNGAWQLGANYLITEGELPAVEKPKPPAPVVAQQEPPKPAAEPQAKPQDWLANLPHDLSVKTDVPAAAIQAAMGSIAQVLLESEQRLEGAKDGTEFFVQSFNNPPSCKQVSLGFRQEKDHLPDKTYKVLQSNRFCLENGGWERKALLPLFYQTIKQEVHDPNAVITPAGPPIEATTTPQPRAQYAFGGNKAPIPEMEWRKLWGERLAVADVPTAFIGAGLNMIQGKLNLTQSGDKGGTMGVNVHEGVQWGAMISLPQGTNDCHDVQLGYRPADGKPATPADDYDVKLKGDFCLENGEWKMIEDQSAASIGKLVLPPTPVAAQTSAPGPSANVAPATNTSAPPSTGEPAKPGSPPRPGAKIDLK
jgi:hypothetical protein